MRSPVARSVMFFSAFAMFGIVLGIYAVTEGAVIVGIVALVGAVILAWCAIREYIG